jgi:hypothetical protein
LEDALESLMHARAFTGDTFTEHCSELQLRALLQHAPTSKQLFSAVPPDTSLRSVLSGDEPSPPGLESKLRTAVNNCVKAWLPKPEVFATVERVLGMVHGGPSDQLQSPEVPPEGAESTGSDGGVEVDPDEEDDRNDFERIREEMRGGTEGGRGHEVDWMQDEFLRLARDPQDFAPKLMGAQASLLVIF